MDDKDIKSEVDETKLTDWSNAPTLLELKQDLTDAQASHNDVKSKIDGWLDNLNVTGKAKINAPKGNSQIVPKLIRKQAEWRYAALSEPFLSTDDVYNVRPVTWEDRHAAEQNQLVLNHQFNNQIDKVKFIDEYVRTAVDEGTAIIRTGWEFQEEEVEEEKPVVQYVANPAVVGLHEQLAQMKQESPSEYASNVPEELKQAHEMSIAEGIPYEPRITGYEKVKVTKTVVNKPIVEICDYRNTYIDPTCMGDIDKAQFVIVSFESSKSQLKKDGKYKNVDHIQVDTNSVLNTPDHQVSSSSAQSFNFQDDPRKKFTVYEYWGYWDIDKTGVVKPIVAAWVGNTLIRLEENPYPDKKLPFVVVQYLPVRKATHGEPDGALLEDNQKIMGAAYRGIIDIMGKSANGQVGTRKDFLDTTNRRKFERGQDYEFNGNVDPRLGVFNHTFPEIPQSGPWIIQFQNQEAESLTGVQAFSQGISGNTLGDVAAGVRGALDAASKRELGILRRLSNGIVKVGHKLISMNSEFLSEEEVVRVTNDKFVTVRRDDLAGSFDLKLSISTAEEDNNKAEQLAFVLQTNAANMDPDLSKMVLSDIMKLRKMPDLAKKIMDFQPQPDPMAEAMQKLAIAKVEAEIAEIQAKTQNLLAGAQLSATKAGTEVAKAENIQSDTDRLNLDYVQEESGTNQERDLQKQGAQAEAQAKTKIIEHQLKAQESDRDFVKEYTLKKLDSKAKK